VNEIGRPVLSKYNISGTHATSGMTVQTSDTSRKPSRAASSRRARNARSHSSIPAMSAPAAAWPNASSEGSRPTNAASNGTSIANEKVTMTAPRMRSTARKDASAEADAWA
jgi:hypothetical protein